MTIRRRLLSMTAVATVALIVALGLGVASTPRVLSAYAIVLAGLGLLALTRLAHEAAVKSPSIFEQWLTPPVDSRGRPPELVRIEREITLGAASAAHLHRRLLPLLREAAATRLSARRRIDIERRPDEARELLGQDVWDVLRPDLPEPLDRNGPGLSVRRIERVVRTLEQL